MTADSREADSYQEQITIDLQKEKTSPAVRHHNLQQHLHSAPMPVAVARLPFL